MISYSMTRRLITSVVDTEGNDALVYVYDISYTLRDIKNESS